MNPAHPNWQYVYILHSQAKDKYYVGCTNNLETRIAQHMQGRALSTKSMLPVELVYYEAYRSKTHAYNREKNLKHYGTGLSRLKARIGWAG